MRKSNKYIWSINSYDKKITLISLIIPLLMKSLFEQICENINTIVLSGYSPLAVNASSVANEILGVGNVLISIASTGTVIIAAIKLGENNTREAGNIIATGTVSMLFATLFIATIEFFCAEFFMSMMNLYGETLELAVDYFRMKALFVPFLSVSSYFGSVIICNGYPKYTLIVGGIHSTLNLIVSYIAVYLPLPFMTPITRVALFSGIVNFFIAGMMVFVFIKAKCPFRLLFIPKTALNIVKLGSSGVMCSLIYRGTQSFTTSLIADMGTDIMNTKIYISNIVIYIPLLCYAISSANSVFMGRLKGAGEFCKQKILYRQNILLSSVANLILSLTVLILHRPLMHVFTDNEKIIKASAIIFVLDIFVEIPRAVSNISESSLNANGDVRATFATSTVSCLFCNVVLAYVFCVTLDMGLVGIWFSYIFAEFFKAMIYILRWRSEKWNEIKL